VLVVRAGWRGRRLRGGGFGPWRSGDGWLGFRGVPYALSRVVLWFLGWSGGETWWPLGGGVIFRFLFGGVCFFGGGFFRFEGLGGLVLFGLGFWFVLGSFTGGGVGWGGGGGGGGGGCLDWVLGVGGGGGWGVGGWGFFGFFLRGLGGPLDWFRPFPRVEIPHHSFFS